MNPADHAWWLASRASGIVAILTLSGSVLLGLVLSTRVVRGPGLPKWVSTAHEQSALTALVAIALHGVTLLGDPFLRASLADITIPFQSDYRPLYTGLGVVGGYLAAALGLSFYVRKRIGAARWRKLHRLTIVAYALAVVHTIGAGTDSGWLNYVVLTPAGPIAVLFVQRLIPRRAPARSPQAPRPADDGSPAAAGSRPPSGSDRAAAGRSAAPPVSPPRPAPAAQQ
jgi:sulfoxide reductase heme-binding subunit YedZ